MGGVLSGGEDACAICPPKDWGGPDSFGLNSLRRIMLHTGVIIRELFWGAGSRCGMHTVYAGKQGKNAFATNC